MVNQLNFLDITVTLKTNLLKTNLHKKTSNIGLYFPKLSFGPENYKKNTIFGLFENLKN